MFLESRRPKIISYIPDYLLSVSVTNIETPLYISMNHSTLAPYWCMLVCPSFPCSTSLYLLAQMHAPHKVVHARIVRSLQNAVSSC